MLSKKMTSANTLQDLPEQGWRQYQAALEILTLAW